MLKQIGFSIGAALLAASVTAGRDDTQQARLNSASAAIEREIHATEAYVGIAFRTLDGKMEWFYQADQSFHAASTTKVPVLIELFRQAREGKANLGENLTVRNEFHSIVDGSVYRLDPADDSETELYKAEGQTRTLQQLAEEMITVSSNLATNLLIQRLGVENIRATVHSLDAGGMNVLRGVEDGKAFEKGLNNTTTARGLMRLLEAIAQGKAVDAEASKHMIAILERQQFNEGIPAGLPTGIIVAHKTGEITGIHHDGAIVYAKRPFVLVVLVRGITDKKRSAALIAEMARQLYKASQ